jgi:hypothetical protein
MIMNDFWMGNRSQKSPAKNFFRQNRHTKIGSIEKYKIFNGWQNVTGMKDEAKCRTYRLMGRPRRVAIR